MKKFIAMLLALVMVLSMVACAGGESAKTETKEEPKTEAKAEAKTEAKEAPKAEAKAEEPAALTGTLRVSIQSWIKGKYDWDSMKADFEAKHPGVTVEIGQVEDSEITAYMLEWSQGSTTSDLVFGNSREMIAALVANGYVTPVDDVVEDIGKDNFYQGFLELGNINGTQYMIPICCEEQGISCNIEAFEKAGLLNADGSIPQPATWEELREMAIKLKDAGYTGLSIDWGSNEMHYVYAAAINGLRGSIYEDDGKTIDFASDEAKYILQFWQDLYKDGISPVDTFADNSAGRTNFKANQVGMLLAPASRWIECQDQLGEGRVGLIEIPGNEKYGTNVFIHGAYVCNLSGETQQKLAKLFIEEELLREDILVAAMNTFGKMSPLKAHYTEENLKDPYWPACISATESGFSMPLYKDYNQLNMDICTSIQSCIVGEISAEECSAFLYERIHQYDLSTGVN